MAFLRPIPSVGGASAGVFTLDGISDRIVEAGDLRRTAEWAQFRPDNASGRSGGRTPSTAGQSPDRMRSMKVLDADHRYLQPDARSFRASPLPWETTTVPALLRSLR